MVINDGNFLLVAMHHYQNPSCVSIEEFQEDLKRITYIKKLLIKPEKNVRLLLNHIIIFFNVFGDVGLYLLLHKVDRDLWGSLVTFLLYIDRMPEVVPEVNLRLSDVKLNTGVITELRKL